MIGICRCPRDPWCAQPPRCTGSSSCWSDELSRVRERRRTSSRNRECYDDLMPCPACGGLARVQVAPNYWECRTKHVIDGVQMMPVAGRPWLTEPQPRQSRIMCHTRYQEGGQGVAGEQVYCVVCGTFAIGRCTQCGEHVCHDHSRLFNDRRLCINDALEAQAILASAGLEAAKQKRDEEAAEIRRQEVIDRTLVEMSPAQAFDCFFFEEPPHTRQLVRSSKHVLVGLDPEDFITTAVSQLSQRQAPSRFCPYSGGGHVSLLRRVLREVSMWWLPVRIYRGSSYGISVDGDVIHRWPEEEYSLAGSRFVRLCKEPGKSPWKTTTVQSIIAAHTPRAYTDV